MYLTRKVHNHNFHVHFTKGLGAGVNIVQSRFHSFEISSEFLVNADIALRDRLVGIIDAAATDAWSPCSHTSAAFAPEMHTSTIKWNVGFILVFFRESNMLWLVCQSVFLVH